MPSRSFQTLLLGIFVASLGTLACDLSTLTGGLGGGKPEVKIQSPSNGSQFKDGEEITIQSISTDPAGIVRVELSVDGTTIATAVPPLPTGQTSFNLVQKWKATAGAHTLTVRAFNASGAASDPAIVSISVVSSSGALATSTAQAGQPRGGQTPSGSTPSGDTTPSVSVPTPTRRPPTRVPPTATPAVPPGIYAMAIRLDPAAPRINQFVTFYVTFLNTASESKKYRWFVKIYKPDERNSFGETAKSDNDIPVGRIELATPNNWKVGGFGDCQPYFARAFWVDAENNVVTEFLKPDGQGVNQGFSVCP